MVKRTCPSCNTDWFSALSQEDWICDKCGTLIPKEENNNGNK